MKHLTFNPRNFGLEGKNLALVELDLIAKALNFIFEHASDEMKTTLKCRYAFNVIPVWLDRPAFAGKRMAVIDEDKAQKAFKYIRENVEPSILKVLKTQYEFELMPFKVEYEQSTSVVMFVPRIVKGMLGVAFFMWLISFF